MADLNLNAKDEKTQLKALEDLYKQRRFSDALSDARRLKDDFPRSFHIRFLYVKILKDMNRLAEAEDSLREMLQIHPNNLNVLLELGKLSTQRTKFDEALEQYNKVLFLDPFNSEAKAAIDRITLIKKNQSPGEKKDVGFASYSSEKLHRADTLPEFDSRDLKEITMRAKTGPIPKVPPSPGTDQKEDNITFLPLTPRVSTHPIPSTPPAPSTAPTMTPTMTAPLKSPTTQIMTPTSKSPTTHTPPPATTAPITPPPTTTPPIMTAPSTIEPPPSIKEILREDTQEEFPFEPSFFEETDNDEFNDESKSEFPVFRIDLEEPEESNLLTQPAEEPGLNEPEFMEILPHSIPDEDEVREPGSPIFEPAHKFDLHLDLEPETGPGSDFDLKSDSYSDLDSELAPGPGLLPEPPVATVSSVKTGDDENMEFVTESAAELYLNQKLFSDALSIYQKLYERHQDERFLVRIIQLKKILVDQKKIQLLLKFLKSVQQKYIGDHHV